MEAEGLANDLAALMEGMPKGLYLLLCVAIDQLGGELRIETTSFAQLAAQPPPQMELQAAGTTVTLRPGK